MAALTVFLRLQNRLTDDRRLPFKTKLMRLDPVGCFVFIGGICCLLLALQWGGQTLPWTSATVLGLLIGSVAIFALFGRLEWKAGETALIPLRIFRQRSIVNGAMVLMFLGASTYVVSMTYPVSGSHTE